MNEGNRIKAWVEQEVAEAAEFFLPLIFADRTLIIGLAQISGD